MTLNEKNNNVPIEIFVVLFLGIVLRIVLCVVHYTHYDDMGYIVSSIANDGSTLLPEQKWQLFFGGYGWTYGPAQTRLIMSYLKPDNDYMTIVFLGRLPSLISGITLAVLMVYIIQKYICISGQRKIDRLSLLAGTILVSLSWEEIIFSAQAEPYAIGELFVVLVILLVLEDYCSSALKSILAIVCFILGCYSQYQMFMVVFAAVVSLYLFHFSEKIKRLRAFATGVSAFVVSIPLLVGISQAGALDRGVNWNAGIGRVFLFELPTNGNRLMYIIKYFVQNSVVVFRYIFCVDTIGIVGTFVGSVLFILAIVGVVRMHNHCLRFALFQDILLAEFFVMILRGSLTLGPSRHILFIIPFMVINASLGMSVLVEFHNVFDYIFKALLVTIIVTFLLSIPGEFEERKNLIGQRMMADLAHEYDVDYIYEYASTSDIDVMKIDGYINGYHKFLLSDDMKFEPETGDRVLVYSRCNAYQVTMDNALPILQKELEDIGYSKEWAALDKCNVLYSDDVIKTKEVEYASQLYFTKGYEKHIYVFEF